VGDSLVNERDDGAARTGSRVERGTTARARCADAAANLDAGADDARAHRTGVCRRGTSMLTPTLETWLNMVERFFAEITERQIKTGVQRSERELEQAILAYVNARNKDPKPFKSVHTFADIVEAGSRFCLRANPGIPRRNSYSGY